MPESESLVYRLRKRAEIRRAIPSRKSVQAGEPDRLADLLDEAAAALEFLEQELEAGQPSDAVLSEYKKRWG